MGDAVVSEKDTSGDVERLEEEKPAVEPRTEVEGRDFRCEGNDVSGYIGVDPEYMTYANDTEKPILTAQEEWDYTNNLDHLEGNMDEEAQDAEVEKTDAEVEDTKTDEDGNKAPDGTSATFNAPVGVPGVITPTL